jgi:hypothetical protein
MENCELKIGDLALLELRRLRINDLIEEIKLLEAKISRLQAKIEHNSRWLYYSELQEFIRIKTDGKKPVHT